jgi:hypothetical protein
MINEKYYQGFEYEVEVVIYYLSFTGEKVGWKIWVGYFETLLSGCFFVGISDSGILGSWTSHEGFFDEKPWKVKNNSTVIFELKQFAFEKTEIESESNHMYQVTLKLYEDLLKFFEDAEKNQYEVFIEYD